MRGIEMVKSLATQPVTSVMPFSLSLKKKLLPVVRDFFVVMGLGQVFHDQPSILHFGKPGCWS